MYRYDRRTELATLKYSKRFKAARRSNLLFFLGGGIGIALAVVDSTYHEWFSRHWILFFPVGCLYVASGINMLRNIQTCARYDQLIRWPMLRSSLRQHRWNIRAGGSGLVLIGLVVVLMSVVNLFR